MQHDDTSLAPLITSLLSSYWSIDHDLQMTEIFQAFTGESRIEEVLNAPGQTSLRNERKNEKLTEILKPRKPAFEVYKFETF